MNAKRGMLLFLLLLTGCHKPPATYEELFVRRCLNDGYVDQSEEFKNCVDKQWAELNKNKQAELNAEAAAAKRVKKAQLATDKARCKEYGLIYGTKDFAGCMINLDATRNNAQISQQTQQAEARQHTIPPDVQAKLKNLAYLRSVDNGTTRTTGALLGRLGESSDEAAIKTELLQNGWNINDINQLLQSSLPPPAAAPAPMRTTDCYPTVGNGFSCTQW